MVPLQENVGYKSVAEGLWLVAGMIVGKEWAGYGGMADKS